MPQSPRTSSILQDRIKELKEIQELEKVVLTPEVEQYYQEHIEAIQEKLAKGEAILESDLKFIDEVMLWMSLSEKWRNIYHSIEAIQNLGEINEAKKRQINLSQWLDLLHVAEVSGHNEEWIKKEFDFKNGKIYTEELSLNGLTDLASLPTGLILGKDLWLNSCTNLTSLPEGLEVGGELLLKNCNNLSSLPKGLKVRGHLILERCTSLTSLPEGLEVGEQLSLKGCTSLTSLPEGLKVGYGINLNGCTNLIYIPEGLGEMDHLNISGCTKLTSLPKDLVVDKLYLYKNLNEQVIKDAERLKKEGKIKNIYA